MNPNRTLGALLLAALALPAALHAQPGRDTGRTSGWIGISFSMESDGTTEAVHVSRVAPGSPAERAFVRAGDVVLRIDGAAATGATVERLRANLRAGDTVRLVIREPDGDQENRLVIAAARPEGGDFVMRLPTIATLPGGAMRGLVIDGDTVRLPPLDSLMQHMDSLRTQIRILRSDGDGTVFRFEGDSTMIRSLSDSSWVREFRNDSTWVRFRRDFEEHVTPELRLRFEQDFGPDGARLRVWSDSIARDMARINPEIERSLRAVGEMPFLSEFAFRSLAGAEFAELNPELGRYFRRDEGLLVLKVSPESPAARAGLRAGDVVVSVGGQGVADVAALRRATARAENGRLSLEVVRDGRARTMEMEWDRSAPRVIRMQRSSSPRSPRS